MLSAERLFSKQHPVRLGFKVPPQRDEVVSNAFIISIDFVWRRGRDLRVYFRKDFEKSSKLCKLNEIIEFVSFSKHNIRYNKSILCMNNVALKV